MKKQLFLKIFVLGVITPLLARSVSDHKAAYKTSDVQDGSNPSLSVININNHAYWIYKDGSGTYDGSPNGTQQIIRYSLEGLYKDGQFGVLNQMSIQVLRPSVLEDQPTIKV